MEETKPVKTGAGESLSEEQATSISGGDGTTSTTASAGTSGFNVTTSSTTDPGAALTAIYEGFVDVTSHIIERIVGAVKN